MAESSGKSGTREARNRVTKRFYSGRHNLVGQPTASMGYFLANLRNTSTSLIRIYQHVFFLYAANHEDLPRTSHVVSSIATCTTYTPGNKDRVSLEVFSRKPSSFSYCLGSLFTLFQFRHQRMISVNFSVAQLDTNVPRLEEYHPGHLVLSLFNTTH